MKLARAALLGALLSFVAGRAHAAILVFDPANYSQNVLTAARTLEEVRNQLVQLQNEAQMLMNDALNLTKLPFNIVPELRAALASTSKLIREAGGLAFELRSAQQRFTQAYPPLYTPGTPSGAMKFDADQRRLISWASVYSTISMQAQAAQNLSRDEDALASLIDSSQGAIGALQAAQATNQLLALHARQLIQAEQVRISQDRARAVEQGRVLADEVQAREVRRQFVGTGTPYTPTAVAGFGY